MEILEFTVDIALIIVAIHLFFVSSDVLKKELLLFSILFVVFVVFSDLIFGKSFSRLSETFMSDLNQIKYSLYVFIFIFFYINRSISIPPPFRLSFSRKVHALDWVLSIPVLIFLAYYASSKGFRLDSSYVESVDIRSIWVDYVFVYCIVCLVALRGSSLIMWLMILVCAFQFIAAERMRVFIYAMSLLIVVFHAYDRKNLVSMFLIGGFFLATMVGKLRQLSENIVANEGVNLTHFGEVSISSMYLLDESTAFSLYEKFDYLIGIIVFNILPTFVLGDEYNIRHQLFEAQNIPGGGWYPVWWFVIGGLPLLILFSIITGMLYRWLVTYKSSTIHTRVDIAKYAMLVVFVSTAPRWFMYTPYQVLKMPLYAFIGTYGLRFFIDHLQTIKRK